MTMDTTDTTVRKHSLTWKNTVANAERTICGFLGRCLVVAVATIATMPLLPSHIRATIEDSIVLGFSLVFFFFIALSLLNWIFLKMVESVEKWVVECRDEKERIKGIATKPLSKLTKEELEKAAKEWERRFNEYFAAAKAVRPHWNAAD